MYSRHGVWDAYYLIANYIFSCKIANTKQTKTNKQKIVDNQAIAAVRKKESEAQARKMKNAN